MGRDQEDQKTYIIHRKTIPELTDTLLSVHSGTSSNLPCKNNEEVQEKKMEIDFGVFCTAYSAAEIYEVCVAQKDHDIHLSCSCGAIMDKLCAHEIAVLVNILELPEWRIFFDSTMRRLRLLQIAKDYGLEKEQQLDAFFQLGFMNGRLEINPRMRELIRVNAESIEQIESLLLPEKRTKSHPTKHRLEVNREEKMILVLRNHRYYEQLTIELFEGKTTQSGKIKNPLLAVDPMVQIWNAEQIAEVKFFTAVSRFQNNLNAIKSSADMEGLRHIVNNPLGLEVYCHHKEISENITAHSIIAIELMKLAGDIKLYVFLKGDFYEISAELMINGKAFPLKTLNIQYGYFVRLRAVLYLIQDPDMLRIIEFFKTHNEKVLIHTSRYATFKQNILDGLEDRIHIHYAYIKSANKQQLIDFQLDRPVQKIIYLSDQQGYVGLTPVMRYGQVEIPVFSTKQIYDSDQNGNVFKIEREEGLESAFTALIVRQHADFVEQMAEATYFYLHKEKFLNEDWFLNAFEVWENKGIEVLGFNDLKKNKLNKHKAKITVAVISGVDWFHTSLSVRFGDQTASLKQLHKAIGKNSRFVSLGDGTLGVLPEQWLKKMAEYFRYGEVEEDLIKIPKSSYTKIHELFEQHHLSASVKNELAVFDAALRNFDQIKEVPVPQGLNAVLRDYQHQGLNWLNFLDDFNFGACLADDMGLGKTIQILAFILLQRTKQKQNSNLVIVPTSILFNWQAEVAKFAPSITILTHYGSSRAKNCAAFNRYEIILTTYGTLISDVRFLKEFHFNYLFLDESQAIKNPDSQRYMSARLLQSRNKVVLTGTPIENNTFDLYGQLSFACPGLLGSKRYFKDIYSIPIDKFEEQERRSELQNIIRPFILRRTKQAVAKELPEKTEMVIYCEMGEEQRKVYNHHEKEFREYLCAKKWEDIAKESMHVLAELTKLRQICDAPILLKAAASLSEQSTKIDVLMEQIESKSAEHKILVFSQFVSMLELIKNQLDKRHISYAYLTGKTKDRAAEVNKFQENNEVRVFLISLKAGGVGLNLTKADYVYIMDPWWNPAIENQAIDRCYRIGQEKHVIAVRLICPDTIEEKIMKLQQSKINLVNELIETERTGISAISKNDLLAMLDR